MGNIYSMDGMQIGMQILSRFPVSMFISFTCLDERKGLPERDLMIDSA